MERSSMQKEAGFSDVQDKLRGVSFPLDRSTAEDKLSGVRVGGKDITQYFDKINWPINSQDQLMNEIQRAQRSL